MAVRLSEELAEFVEGGLSMLVGTRDAAMRPKVDRAVGTFVGADRQTITIYLNKELGAQAVANLEDNGTLAVTVSRPYDHRSLQLKGQMLSLREGTEEDRVKQERWLTGFVEHLYIVGLPRSVVRQLKVYPSVAVTMRIDDLFEQSPGPGAGRRFEAGSTA
jgi:hypothetical protein